MLLFSYLGSPGLHPFSSKREENVVGSFQKVLVKCHNKVISNWPLTALLVLLLTNNFFSYFKRPNFFAQDKDEEAEAGPVEVVIVVEGRSSEQTSSSQTNTGA